MGAKLYEYIPGTDIVVIDSAGSQGLSVADEATLETLGQADNKASGAYIMIATALSQKTAEYRQRIYEQIKAVFELTNPY